MDRPRLAVLIHAGAQDRRFVATVEPLSDSDEDTIDAGGCVVNTGTKLRNVTEVISQ